MYTGGMANGKKLLKLLQERICERLGIDDFHFVEIESKKRVLPKHAKDLKKYLIKKTDHVKSTFFLDQFLDTPQMDLFRLGASMRLRYKKNGSQVYLQYKGPGYKEQGLLYRSEFSSQPLKHLTLEESHHDMIHFTKTPIQSILRRGVPNAMRQALKKQLGAGVVARISVGPIICVYQKEKFKVKMGKVFLEPSLDRIMAFHINKSGLHPLSTFWEYENEVKAEGRELEGKISHVPDLLEFDEKLTKKFDLKPEPLDKYHRCTSIFLPKAALPK